MKNSDEAYLSGKAPEILVVDDDKTTRRMVKAHLRKAGYNVIDADNGQAGLERFDEHSPALVLLDVMMPVMNGFETCMALRTKIADQTLQILMLTGLDDVDAVERAFQCGATDFITKPLNWPLLTQRVRFALRDRKLFIELQEKQRLLSEAQRIAKMGCSYIDLSAERVVISDEASAIMGIADGGEISLHDFYALLPDQDRQRMQENLDQAVSGNGLYQLEHKLTLDDKQEKVILQRGEVRRENGRNIIYGTLQDITEQAKAEERILYHTYYDVLTSLPNRNLFERNLSDYIGEEQSCTVMFVGIDRFKAINDSLGHRSGDELLKEIAGRLAPFQQKNYRVARFGGDTFAIIVPGDDTAHHKADDIAQDILSLMEAPCVIDEHEIVIHGSIGIALYPREANSLDKLLLGADIAMNQAKDNGGNQYRYFSTEMDTNARRRLSLEEDLRRAIRNEEFELYYQPQYCALTKRIVGMEALVRWFHPKKGMISPGDFIPLAEETGLVVELGEWVLYTAARQSAVWHNEGHQLRVGVNLSAKQLILSSVPDLVSNVIDTTHIAPNLLELEITESMAVSSFEKTRRTLDKTRSMGVKVSMDDFGTGYSSLSYLQQLPLNTLKIDRAFIKDITDDGRNGEIAKAIIALSKTLDLHIIAEGIETVGQYDYLRWHGADEIQGFYFSKPLPAAEFSKLLNKP